MQHGVCRPPCISYSQSRLPHIDTYSRAARARTTSVIRAFLLDVCQPSLESLPEGFLLGCLSMFFYPCFYPAPDGKGLLMS